MAIEENYLRYKRNKGSFKLYVSIITTGNGSSLYFTCWQRAYNIPASIKLIPTGKDVELKMEVTSNQLKDNSFIYGIEDDQPVMKRFDTRTGEKLNTTIIPNLPLSMTQVHVAGKSHLVLASR